LQHLLQVERWYDSLHHQVFAVGSQAEEVRTPAKFRVVIQGGMRRLDEILSVAPTRRGLYIAAVTKNCRRHFPASYLARPGYRATSRIRRLF